MSDEVVKTEPEPDKTLPIVLVLRGLPGTGKSTLANLLMEQGATVLSTDEYWSDTNPFDIKKVDDSYKWCFERFKDLIKAQDKFIVVDNSNTKRFHYAHYVDYAQRHGYLVAVTVMPHLHLSETEMVERSTRKINQLTIRKLKEGFEWGL